MNDCMHNEQINAAHKMDAGGKWETMNQLGVALHTRSCTVSLTSHTQLANTASNSPFAKADNARTTATVNIFMTLASKNETCKQR